jgi:hypothetical protein
MSKGLKATAALGTLLIGGLAIHAGAIAQSAGNDGSVTGKPAAIWNFENGSQELLTWNSSGGTAPAYRKVTRGQDQSTSYFGATQAMPKNGARSGN